MLPQHFPYGGFSNDFEQNQSTDWCSSEYGEDAITLNNEIRTGPWNFLIDPNGLWTIWYGRFWFKNPAAAVHFKLRWG